jgi:fumarate reductase subunit D
MAALFLPMLVLIFGVAVPLGWFPPPSRDWLLTVVGHPLTRVAVFVVCVLSLVHGAHRFRYTLYDGLQIKHLNEVINLACYGGAIAGALWAAYLLWMVP